MRGILAILLVGVAAGAGEAKPMRPPPDFDIFDSAPVEPCGTGKTWARVEKCLGAQGATTVLLDVPSAKVVEVSQAASSRLWLYIDRGPEGWVRGGIAVSTGPTAALLAVEPWPVADGQGVRVDVGTTVRTTVMFEPSTALRAILRRVMTTVCAPGGWSCRTVMTSCEAYVRGHLLWQYRGEIIGGETMTRVKLRGDTQRARGACLPSKSLLEEN